MTPLNCRERVFYGLGAVAYGVKETGVRHWLLIFYNQALGLSSEKASAALCAALLVDNSDGLELEAEVVGAPTQQEVLSQRVLKLEITRAAQQGQAGHRQ